MREAIFKNNSQKMQNHTIELQTLQHQRERMEYRRGLLQLIRMNIRTIPLKEQDKVLAQAPLRLPIHFLRRTTGYLAFFPRSIFGNTINSLRTRQEPDVTHTSSLEIRVVSSVNSAYIGNIEGVQCYCSVKKSA